MAFPRKTNTSAIIAAAIDLLEREGEAALTLRRVSSLLGVTPNALYRYYRSRDVLVAATADEVARRMLETIDIAIAEAEKLSGANDEARVRVLTAVYADFADTHPNLYRTLMTPRHRLRWTCRCHNITTSSGQRLSTCWSPSPVGSKLPQPRSRYGAFCTGYGR